MNCRDQLAKSNCHILMLSFGTFVNNPAAYMPATWPSYCILEARDLEKCKSLFLVCAVCQKFWAFITVYYDSGHICSIEKQGVA